jgi:hypothetical protein
MGASDEFAKNLARLEQLKTSRDFDRILNNFAKWQKLEKSQRERLRKLHTDLAESNDERRDLEAVMSRYAEWLDSLPPAKRDQLTNELEPKRRIELVRTFVNEERNQLLADLKPVLEDQAKATAREGGSLRFSRRNPGEIRRLETLLTPRLSEQQRKKIQSVPSEDLYPWLLVYGRQLGVEDELIRAEKSEFLFRFLYSQIRMVSGQPLSTRRHPEPTEEEKSQLLEMAAIILSLPMIDRPTLLEHRATLKLPAGEFFWRSHKFNPSLFWQLLSYRYLLDNPAKVPKEFVAEVERLRPFAAQIRATGNEATKSVGPREPPPDKANPSSVKPRGQ